MNTARLASVLVTTAPHTSLVPSIAASKRRLAHLTMPVGVFQHDDEVIDQHSDGERDARQARHVQRAAHQTHHQEHAHDARRRSKQTRQPSSGKLRKNNSSTITVSTPPSAMFSHTSAIDELMYSVS